MTEQRRKAGRIRRKKIRRMKRAALAWAVRIAVVLAGIAAAALLVWGARTLWGRLSETDRSTSEEADAVGSGERREGTAFVMIDAGHGGKDQGTSSGDVLEKDINLTVALMVAEELEKSGVSTALMRTDDTFVSLEDRAARANEKEVDLFVSIHCNYSEDDASVQGLECYYREGSEEGEALADSIIASVEELDEVTTRGTKTEDFRVLRKTTMPAALVEIGYLSNARECRNLTDEDYQQKLAQKIAEGIIKMTE